MKKLMLLFIFISVFFSCDFCTEEDNGIVKVYNDTLAPIRVYYTYEVENDSYSELEESDDVNVVYGVDTIRPGESKKLKIQSNINFKGSLDIIYGGIHRNYIVGFNSKDYGVNHVSENHFHELVKE